MSATNPHQLLVLMIFTSVLMTVIAYHLPAQPVAPDHQAGRSGRGVRQGAHACPTGRAGRWRCGRRGGRFWTCAARIERQIEQRTLMLSGVSHDLRTPLTRLRLGLSLMPEDAEVAALQADVSQMERMVDEFLSFVRGDAMEGIGADGCGGAWCRAWSSAGRARACGLSAVEGDGRAGADAAAGGGAGGGESGRQCPALWHDGSKCGWSFLDRSLRIMVEDDGPGIPPRRRDEALRPFTRLDAARDPNRGGGVGLGLSIAADIALSHGGQLRLSRQRAAGRAEGRSGARALGRLSVEAPKLMTQCSLLSGRIAEAMPIPTSRTSAQQDVGAVLGRVHPPFHRALRRVPKPRPVFSAAVRYA